MSPATDFGKIADLYDSFVRFEEDIPFFLRQCRRIDGPVLELMSGTGRVSLPLIEAGVDLTCVDSSPEMLAVLRAKLDLKGLSARIITRDVAALELPAVYELAVIPFHSFAELLTREDRQAALRAVHAALAPGGRFVVTLHNPAIRRRSMGQGLTTYGTFPLEDGTGEVVLKTDLSFDPETRRAHGVQILEQLDANGELMKSRTLPLQFILLEREAFEGLAREAGFEIERLYGDYQRSPFSAESSPYMIWRLRKADS